MSQFLPVLRKIIPMNDIRLFRYFLACLFVWHNSMLFAQAPTGTDALWSELEEQIQKGNKRALRDLATFLDKPNYTNATRHTLMRYTFFTKNEIELSTATRTDFLNFFYDNESKLKFSEVLQAFYRTPIEEQGLDTTVFNIQIVKKTEQISPSVKLPILTQKFDSLFQKNQKDLDIQLVIKEISALGTPSAYDWLRRTLTSEPFTQKDADAYLTLCEGLKTDPSIESLEAILSAIERRLVHPELLSDVFRDLTNIAVSAIQTHQLLDSLSTLEAIRTHGYDHWLTFRETFFYEKVDYYGKILSHSNIPMWTQRNALHDLIETHHPRLLFFLAAQVRLKPDEKDDYMNVLEILTNNQYTFTKNPKPNGDAEEADIEKWKSYVRWWAIHHEEFEWDKTTERFISHSEMVERTEEIERLIRRLGSSNDSVAVSSFKQLTENDPAIVEKMMERFRPLLRSYNTRLPEINYPFLRYMTEFTSFCRLRKISLKLPHSLDSLLSILSSIMTPALRYTIENQCIEKITLKNVSALEYYGLLNSSNLAMNFSVSRMLDIFYSKHCEKIVSNNATLSLYIKKTVLFTRLGTGGTSGLYDRKLDIKDKAIRERLEQIARTEGDSDIRNYILTSLNPPATVIIENNSENNSPEKIHPSLAELIEKLKLATDIAIDDLNDFVLDSTYSERYTPELVRFIKKVTPLSSLRRFKLKDHLTISHDLPLFNDMTIAPKDLDDFLSIFKADFSKKDTIAEKELWTFINKQTAAYSVDERGSFWNDMFKVAWFNNLIHSDTIQVQQKNMIISELRNYLIKSEFLSEFEEQTTQIHIYELGNIGHSLTDKLTSTLELDGNPTIKQAVQSAILARIKYEDIGTVAAFWKQKNLNTLKESPLVFLQTDFGIPIFSKDKETITQLIENHKKMSPKAFYSFYLKQFGLNLWNTEGGLNYEKIYDALIHESVVPFTGGGSHRDYFNFGIIKLLEFEFQTRLGFHEKLNENQTFYTFNTAKRNAAWRAFLIEKKLVKVPPSLPPFSKS